MKEVFINLGAPERQAFQRRNQWNRLSMTYGDIEFTYKPQDEKKGGLRRRREVRLECERPPRSAE
jgi:hypothetical protein